MVSSSEFWQKKKKKKTKKKKKKKRYETFRTSASQVFCILKYLDGLFIFLTIMCVANLIHLLAI